MNQVRWGILGAARIAHQFSRDIACVDNATLVAIAARDKARAEDFAAQWDIPRAHAGYDALFSDESINAVYIASPHSCHLQHCLDALAAGKHVLCEKPLVLNTSQCRELMAAHQASDRYLMEGMWTWFLPAIRKAQQWVSEGRIGELLHVKADFGYPIPYHAHQREYDLSLGGGVTLEMGIYAHAITRLFLQEKYDDLKVSAHLAPNGVEDEVSAVFNFGSAMATLGASFRCRLRNSAFIIGTKGYIEIPDFFRAYECFLYERDDCIDHFKEDRETFGFNYQIKEVSQNILDGRTESDVMSLSTSLLLQEDMANIRRHIGLT